MNPVLHPAVAGGAFDDFLRQVAPTSTSRPTWTPQDGAMPALYLSHGAPPLFNDPLWISQLFTWSTSLPKPTAIVIVSAHWEHAPLSISATGAGTPLVYDFGGFAQRYYTMRYDTPDATSLAKRLAATMPDDEPLHQHRSRGLDHGAWVPLKIMYPYADVPVVQLSMPTHDPARLLEIGKRLRELRSEGVLVIGSGYMTHGLPYLDSAAYELNHVPGWSRDFDDWAASALATGDIETLANYDHAAPGSRYAHPTVEHYIPLFVTLGLAADPGQPVTTAIDGFQFGLSKRSFQVA